MFNSLSHILDIPTVLTTGLGEIGRSGTQLLWFPNAISHWCPFRMELDICWGKFNASRARTSQLGSLSHLCGGHIGWVQANLCALIPDLSSAYKEMKLVILPTDKMVASSIIHNCCIPSSPLTPSACITIQCLKLYRIAHLRCPHLSIQPSSKHFVIYIQLVLSFMLAVQCWHFWQVQFRHYLAQQFSIALDVYLAIRHHIDNQVQAMLHCDSPDWRLCHACLACTYRLQMKTPHICNAIHTGWEWPPQVHMETTCGCGWNSWS